MRILCISKDLNSGDLAYRLNNEGHDVKLHIEDKRYVKCFDNIVEKTENWREELNWVGKDGFIVFDHVGLGRIQDELRSEGYLVFGNTEFGEELEHNHSNSRAVLSEFGIDAIERYNFYNLASAIQFVEKNKRFWIFKQNGPGTSLCYVSAFENCCDILNLLRGLEKKNLEQLTITLQAKQEGIEIGLRRFFNGKNWIGPIELYIESKKFLNGDVGPITANMGALLWYNTTDNKLFSETLNKISPFLQRINFKGIIGFNCIIGKNKVHILDIVTRLYSPLIHLQESMLLSPFTNYLMAVAKGDLIEFKYKPGIFIVVTVTLPPFPYLDENLNCHLKDVDIFFKEELTPEEWKQIHFKDVSLRDNEHKYYIPSSNGFIFFVTGHGKTVEDARENAYKLIQKIIIPKMMYRTDIGIKFIENDASMLEKWGWI